MATTFVCVASLLFLIHFQLILPIRARKRSHDHERKPSAAVVSRSSMYRASITVHSVQAVTSLLLGSLNHIQLFGEIHVEVGVILYAIGFLAMVLMPIERLEWKFVPDKVRTKILDFLPHSAQEGVIWGAVSLVTGLSEEIVYRAVIFGLLYKLIGIYWLAGMVSAALFGFAHLSYGRFAAAYISLVGLVLQWFVFISGGLYLSIAIHFLHNLINGLIYGARGHKISGSEATMSV